MSKHNTQAKLHFADTSVKTPQSILKRVKTLMSFEVSIPSTGIEPQASTSKSTSQHNYTTKAHRIETLSLATRRPHAIKLPILCRQIVYQKRTFMLVVGLEKKLDSYYNTIASHPSICTAMKLPFGNKHENQQKKLISTQQEHGKNPLIKVQYEKKRNKPRIRKNSASSRIRTPTYRLKDSRSIHSTTDT